MDFHLSVLARGHCAVVLIYGRCDAGNAERLRDCLAEVLAANSARIVLDLSGLAVLDSAGIDALAAAGRHALRLGGSIAITGGPDFNLGA